MIAAKKLSVSREVRLSDLDGIKKALMFFMEREREKELEGELHRSTCGKFPIGYDRFKRRNEIEIEVNKKYDALTKGLK